MHFKHDYNIQNNIFFFFYLSDGMMRKGHMRDLMHFRDRSEFKENPLI